MLLQTHSAPLTDSCPPFFDSRQSSSAGRRTECKVFSKTRTKGAAAPEEGAGAGGGRGTLPPVPADRGVGGHGDTTIVMVVPDLQRMRTRATVPLQ